MVPVGPAERVVMGRGHGLDQRSVRDRRPVNAVSTDVVVVGGGVAGAALATVLARSGVDVVVLERSTEFQDRVRGENWAPWGVAVLQELGLVEVLLDAGAVWEERLAYYHPDLPADFSEAVAPDLTSIIPGVPGALNIGHPAACGALLAAARSAGATVERGVERLVFDRVNGTVGVTWATSSGAGGQACSRLLVGADGRGSGVRRWAGIALLREPAHHLTSGLLLEVDGGFRRSIAQYGNCADAMWISFPQPEGRARVYMCHANDERRRFTGTNGAQRFIETLAGVAGPEREAFGASRPAGPVASYPSEETWCPEPFCDGVVLVGDAAGYTDPILGQGLSLAIADVAQVARTLSSSDDWSSGRFADYGQDKARRMAHQRGIARLFSSVFATFDAESAAARLDRFSRIGTVPEVSAVMAAAFAGPGVIADVDQIDRAMAAVLAP
jgi:menaquinone-9 beta-reductase